MTDDERMTRLTMLAQAIAPEGWHVDADHDPYRPEEAARGGLGAWVQRYYPQPVGPPEGGDVLLSIPNHPLSVDMLEAALLVGNLDAPRAARLLAAMREMAGNLVQEGP